MAYIEDEVKQLRKEVSELKSTVQRLQEKPEDKKLTVFEVAQRLRLTTGGVNYRIRKGDIKASGGRCKKILESDLKEFERIYFKNQDQIAKE